MKLYEKMGIDPTTEEGIAKLFKLRCESIPDEIAISICPKNGKEISCAECKAERLFKEIPTKQRGSTYTDFHEAYTDWLDYVRNTKESQHSLGYVDWLTEEIEVEE